MTPEELQVALTVHQGRRVLITYGDGVKESVDIESVDDEGCLHSGPDGVEPGHLWTRFTGIVDVEPLGLRTP